MNDKPALRAILRQGEIRALEPLPVDWQEGQSLRVEVADNEEVPAAQIDRDFAILQSLCDSSEPDDEGRLERALQEGNRLAKEQVRRQMELP